LKIGVVIPTRGDRPDFVDFAVRQMESQTMKVDQFEIVDHPAESKEVDLASRFRIGIERCFSADADVVFFIEDDDFYKLNYIEAMMTLWAGARMPVLFGLDITSYYHLGIRMVGCVCHPGRASMYSSMVSKDFDLTAWPKDPERFVDIEIWKKTPGAVAVSPGQFINMGIKHGHGMCGGGMHDPKRFQRMFRNTKQEDENLDYLKEFTGPGFWFYKAIINQLEGHRNAA